MKINAPKRTMFMTTDKASSVNRRLLPQPRLFCREEGRSGCVMVALGEFDRAEKGCIDAVPFGGAVNIAQWSHFLPQKLKNPDFAGHS
jgi:hypothetical protein